MNTTKFEFLNNVFQSDAGGFTNIQYNNINELIDIYNEWQIKDFNLLDFEKIIKHVIKVCKLSPELIDKKFNISVDETVNHETRLIKYIICNTHELYANKYIYKYDNDVTKEIDLINFRNTISKYPQYLEILKHYNITF